MAMRTPLTPALPTGMRLCPVAITVAGRSTIRRAGESAALSLGVTAPWALISTRISSVPRTTFTRCSSLCWPAAGDAGVPAEATSPSSGNSRNTLTNCFRISLPPTRGLTRASFFEIDFSSLCSGFPERCHQPLHCRRNNPLRHFARRRLAQLVLHRLLEYNGVSCDSHHIAVEHGIVLVQEISFVHAVGYHGNEAAVRLHHAPHIDLSDLEAFLAGGATGTRGLLHNRTKEGIA